MLVEKFLIKLRTKPDEIEFKETMFVIDETYSYTPASFCNGNLTNHPGENEASCKIFAFAKLHNLNKQETLFCFGKFYKQDVLGNPDENNHQNIRNFMRYGWSQIKYCSNPLSDK